MGLSKVAIISAPTKEPRAAVHPSSVAAILTPALVAVLQFQQLAGAASLFLGIQASWLAWQFLSVGRFLTYQLSMAFMLSVGVGKTIWKTRAVKQLRKKIAFEFFTLILGSGGNSLFLVVFWPGWWVLGCIVLLVRAELSGGAWEFV